MFLHNIRRFKDSIISRKAKQLSVKNFLENPQQGQKKGRPGGGLTIDEPLKKPKGINN